MDSIRKLKRTGRLVSVLSKYGFETLVTQTGIKSFIPDAYINRTSKRKEIFSLTVYERIRLVLEELGPAYIKLGQLLSNRDDLFPPELIFELQKLQDKVQYQDIDLLKTLESELGVLPSVIFSEIDLKPIAAASLSQVYICVLDKEERKVIVKVKRKGIAEMVEADLMIMKDFSKLLVQYYDLAKQIGLVHIIRTFERSILSELDFNQELSNIEKFRKNFIGDSTTYVPLTYKDYSNTNILCMEYIEGVKVTDVDTLQMYSLSPQVVAENVVNSYLKQVVEFGFFHADPHSGNIFVLTTGEIVFIDYGSVGRIYEKDRDLFASLIIFLLRKDTKRIVRIIKKISIEYNVKDESQFERDLCEFIDVMDSDSIKDVDLKKVIQRFSHVLYENRIILPEYFYLLVRSVLILEGIGRDLGLQSSLIGFVEPYKDSLLKKRMSIDYMKKLLTEKVFTWYDRFEEIPDDIHSLIQKINNDHLSVTHNINGLKDIKGAINLLALTILVSSVTIGSSILILAKMPPLVFNVSFIGVLGILFAGFSVFLIFLSLFKGKYKK